MRTITTMGLVAMVACTGGSDEPAKVGEDVLSEPAYGVFCGATLEEVALDEAVEGFDVTPREALENVGGGFFGLVEGASVDLLLDLDETVQVARVQSYESGDEPEDVVPVSLCTDHYLVSGTMALDAMPMLGLDGAVDIAYADGEDAGDGFGWDTAFFSMRADAWDGYAAPSWDPAEMEVVEMTLFAHWAGGVHEPGTGRTGTDVPASIWTVDVSFWGESKPTGSGDDAAVWAGEELLFDVELQADEG